MSQANELPIPREALGEWLRVAPRGAGELGATLENHFGEAHPGDLIARCALAALATRPGAQVARVQVDWLAPAPPGVPITLRVAPVPGSGALLEVSAEGISPLCRALVEAAAPAGGLDYQDDSLPPNHSDPEALPTTVEYARREGWPEAYGAGPVEFRRVGPLRPNRALGESCDHVDWLKLRAPLPRDAQLEQAALLYLATFYFHWEFERRIGDRFDYAALAPVGHTVWLHRAVRPDGWLLLRARSRIAAGGRALAVRELFAQGGALLATVACEARVAEA